MAQFDVHRLGDTLVLDCQADLLDHLNTRFVVPLLPVGHAPKPARRLNPLFTILGSDYVMVTQFAAAVRRNELGEKIASVSERGIEVTDALDVLTSGV